jgi:uncharacterized Tic20 family protein
MSSTEHIGAPSHQFNPVVPGDFERRQARERITQAFVDGRIDRFDFDRRLGVLLQAGTRSELGDALVGLPSGQQMPPLPSVPAQNTGLAAFGHLSVFFLWIFGPLLTWALAPEWSYARREAAKAFNFQLVSMVVGAGSLVVANILNLGILVPVWMVAWFVLTIAGGLRAAQGQEWTNPVMRVVRWNALDPGGR